MRSKKWILSLGYILLAIPYAPAQESVSATPSPYNGIAGLETELAEVNYKRDPSPLHRDALVSAYEKLLGTYCMPKLFTTLQYSGEPKDTTCLELITKAFALDMANPVATCSRDGIDATSCKEAYFSQKSEVLSASTLRPTLSPSEELTEKLRESQTEQLVSRLAEELNSLTKDRSKEHDSAQQEKIRAVLGKLLTASCRTTRLRLESDKKEKPQSPGRKESRKRYETPAATRVVTPKPPEGASTPSISKPLSRVRSLSKSCKSYIDYSLNWDPTFAAPLCHRDGFYAPSCIVALRNERKKRKEGKSGSTRGTTDRDSSGLETF